MTEVCKICEGSGMRVVERAIERKVERNEGAEKKWVAEHVMERMVQKCVCQQSKHGERMIVAAQIPKRYAHCELNNYDTLFSTGVNVDLLDALARAREFVEAKPKDFKGKGLMFVGKPGLGKTHLAIGVLKGLILQRNVRGLFVDYRDLLKQVQNTYNAAESSTELGVLRPIFDAEVLIIDDLGASKPTDWVFDTVAHILNSRYNDQLTTIITTNFPNRPETDKEDLSRKNEAQRIMTQRTLGDRIGDRVLSRLQEMCMVVELEGSDYRQGIKKARWIAAESDAENEV